MEVGVGNANSKLLNLHAVLMPEYPASILRPPFQPLIRPTESPRPSHLPESFRWANAPANYGGVGFWMFNQVTRRSEWFLVESVVLPTVDKSNPGDGHFLLGTDFLQKLDTRLILAYRRLRRLILPDVPETWSPSPADACGYLQIFS